MSFKTLYPEQREAVDKIVAEPTRAALMASDVGTGKTLCSVEIARDLGAKTILVIAPLNTMGGWKKTFEGQNIDLPFVQIDSSNKDYFDDLKAKAPGIYFIGREYFGISGSDSEDKFLMDPNNPKRRFRNEDGEYVVLRKGRKKAMDWSKVTPDLAVFDEVQSASNRDSVTSKVLRQLKAGFKIAASATPQGNKFENFWTISRWLWKDTTDPSFWRWTKVWCSTEYSPHTQSGQKIVGEREPGAYVKTLPCYVRLEREKTPEVVRKCLVDLTPAQRVLYNEMSDDMLTWLADNPLVADFSIVQKMRLRQISLGEVSFNDKDEVDFEIGCKSAKVEALHKIVKLHPDEPMLILMDSAKFVKVVVDALGEGAVAWTGNTKKSLRDKYKAEFGSTVKYIVAVISAISEGTDGLQLVSHIEVWFNESVNQMHNTQASGRLNRDGQKAPQIYSYKLIARDSDDDDYFQKAKAKTLAVRASLAVKKEAA